VGVCQDPENDAVEADRVSPLLAREIPMVGADRILELISPARRDVLVALRSQGESWAAGLAAELHLSVSALRQTLTTLEAEGLVSSRQVRSGPGRPRVYYRLTDAAESLFQQRHSAVYRLLDAALDLTAEGRDVTVDSWARRLAQEGIDLAGATSRNGGELAQRLRSVEDLLDRAGFAPQLDVDEARVSVNLRRCPLLELARSRPLVCELERRSIGAQLGSGNVERKEHRLAGDDGCVYTFALSADPPVK
jgi:DeoR family suf operon transcriptional repressor